MTAIRVVPAADMRDLVARSRRPCAVCHRRGALNPHRICKKKIQLLRGCEWLHRRGYAWVRIEAGDKMFGGKVAVPAPYRAGALASYLKWFGLMEDKGHRTALWRVTDRGRLFLAGDFEAPAQILCRDGRPLYASKETVGVRDVIGVVLDRAYWDRYPASDLQF